MTATITADVLVVCFGKGGKTTAHALTDAGKRVVLVERSANMYGGTCPNVGCVPTKMLVHYSGRRGPRRSTSWPGSAAGISGRPRRARRSAISAMSVTGQNRTGPSPQRSAGAASKAGSRVGTQVAWWAAPSPDHVVAVTARYRSRDSGTSAVEEPLCPCSPSPVHAPTSC